MTNTIASSAVNESVNVMTQTITNVTNDCSTTVSNGSYSIVLGGNSVNCNLTENSELLTTVDMSCVASTSTQNTINNNLVQTAVAQAEAINQQFGLAAFSESYTMINSYLNLSNVMQTTFNNSCSAELSSNQVSVIDCQGSTNFVVDANYKSTVQLTQDCLFNNTAVTDVTNNIKQSLSAYSKTVIQNFLAGIFFAIALVIVAGAIFLFLILLIMKSGKKGDAPIVVGSGESTALEQGGDFIALAAALTGKPVTTQSTAQSDAFNPMSFLAREKVL